MRYTILVVFLLLGRTTLAEHRACRAHLEGLSSIILTSKINQKLSQLPDPLSRFSVSDPRRVPTEILEVILRRLESEDAHLHIVLKYCAGLAETERSESLNLNLLIELNIFVFGILKLRTFRDDPPSATNAAFFARDFEQEIDRAAERLDRGEKLRITDAQKATVKSFVGWINGKMGQLRSLRAEVESNPNLLQKPFKHVDEAMRLVRIFQDSVPVEDATELVTLEDWHLLANISNWMKTDQTLRPNSQMRRAPNVRLTTVDPLWLFNSFLVGEGYHRNVMMDAWQIPDRFERLAEYGRMGDFFENPEWFMDTLSNKKTNITDRTSRGLPLLTVHEPFERQIFWPRGNWTPPNFDHVRIAVTKNLEGRKLNLEIFLSGDQGWEPFFFERQGDHWVLQETILGKPVKMVCAGCHTSDGSGSVRAGELSPRPSMLRSVNDFKQVGYLDEAIIRELIKF